MILASPDDRDALAARFARLPVPPTAAGWPIRDGSVADYQALAEYHYRARRPATASRVLVLADPRPGVIDRFTRPHPAPPPVDRPVAVLVESLPALSCAARDLALHHRYGPPVTPRQRGDMLNREARTISRVVVHPTYRGMGLAVRLVRHALATATTPFTEALAAMGRVHPFFTKAGMTAYARPRSPAEARVADALRSVGLTADRLADRDATWRHLEALTAPARRMIDAELFRFHATLIGRRRSHRTRDTHAHLAFTLDRLAFQPTYFLHDNRGGTVTRNP
jgi:GNAT superfamily N-acetyltransferase